MVEDNNTNAGNTASTDIDWKAIALRLWAKRKFILKVAGVISAWGLVVAICQKKEYTTECTFVPQFSSATDAMSFYSFSMIPSTEAIESLLAGKSMSPLVYPQLLEDVDFNKELMYTPLHFSKFSEPVTLYDYFNDPKYKEFNFVKTVKKYTVDLPGRMVRKLIPAEPEIKVPSDGKKGISFYTKSEADVALSLAGMIEMSMDKKEFYYTLTVKVKDNLACAELCQATLDLLGKYITKFRIEHARQYLDHIKELHAETETTYKEAQLALAKYVDSNRGAQTATTQIRKEQLTSEYNLALSAYSEMSKQLLLAEVKVREDTPSLSNVKVVSIPNEPSNSRFKTLLSWLFFGMLLSISLIFSFDWMKSQGIRLLINWK